MWVAFQLSKTEHDVPVITLPLAFRSLFERLQVYASRKVCQVSEQETQSMETIELGYLAPSTPHAISPIHL